MKKVLVITYYWPPSGGPGVQRWLKFVKYFPEFNVEPYILTVDPDKANYPIIDPTLEAEVSDKIKVYRTNSFEFYNLYKKLTGSKEVPYSGFANESEPGILKKVGRFVRGNFFLPDPRKGWNKYAYKKAVEIIKAENIDTIITTSPPHSTQLIGLKLKKNLNVKWIADLRDPWTDIYYYNKFYPTKIAKGIDEKYELEVLRNADAVTVVSNDIKRMFIAKSVEVDPEKIKVIPNGYDEDDFSFPSNPSKEKFIITYSGTLTETYGMETFFDMLKDLDEDIKKVLQINFIGKVSNAVKHQIDESNLTDLFEFKPYVPHSEAIQNLMHSTVLLLAIPKVPNNKGILTGKIFEYLASKKPVIGIGPVDGDAAAILTETNGGKMFNYGDVDGLKAFFLKLYQKWSENRNIDCTDSRSEKFSRRALTEDYAKILEL